MVESLLSTNKALGSIPRTANIISKILLSRIFSSLKTRTTELTQGKPQFLDHTLFLFGV